MSPAANIRAQHAQQGPWRRVVSRQRMKISRTRAGNSVWHLKLECGHGARAIGDRGHAKKVRCHQCTAIAKATGAA